MKTLQKLLGGIALISSAYLGLGLKNKTYADTINVPSQYSTIQSAVNNAVNGDEIIVAQGRYLENVLIEGKGIKIKSTNPLDQNIVKSTVIDGQTSNSVITLTNIRNSTATLEGLTIMNGKAQYGGGINAKNSIFTLDNCVVTSNSCFGGTEPARGGGIYCENSTVTMRKCNIENNSVLGGTMRYTDSHRIITGYGKSGDGGGLYLSLSQVLIDNCNITSNTSRGGDAHAQGYIHIGYGGSASGGGIYANNSSLTVFSSCVGKNRIVGGDAVGISTVGGNSFGGGLYCETTTMSLFSSIIFGNICNGGNVINQSRDGSAIGGGIYDLDSSTSLFSCTIVDNNVMKGEHGGGIENGGGIYGDYKDIINTILWNNHVNQIDGTTTATQPLYCDIQDWPTSGTGNISLDPQFVDSANNDYHLKSTSPCIDAGTTIEGLLYDFEGDRRPQGREYDIGAYEFVLKNNEIDSKVWNMYE